MCGLVSGNPYTPKHPSHIQTRNVKRNHDKLLGFSIKKYEQRGAVTDHIQLEALLKRKQQRRQYPDHRFLDILRISFALNGLTMHFEEYPRSSAYINTKNYIVEQYYEEAAFQRLMSWTQRYEDQQYSLLSNNCNTFIDRIVDSISYCCGEVGSSYTVWKLKGQYQR